MSYTGNRYSSDSLKIILTIPCLPRQQPLRLNIVCHLSRHSFLIQCSYNPPNSLFVSHVNPLNNFLCPMSTTSNQLDIVCQCPQIQSSQDPLWTVPPPVFHLYNVRVMSLWTTQQLRPPTPFSTLWVCVSRPIPLGSSCLLGPSCVVCSFTVPKNVMLSQCRLIKNLCAHSKFCSKQFPLNH